MEGSCSIDISLPCRGRMHKIETARRCLPVLRPHDTCCIARWASKSCVWTSPLHSFSRTQPAQHVLNRLGRVIAPVLVLPPVLVLGADAAAQQSASHAQAGRLPLIPPTCCVSRGAPLGRARAGVRRAGSQRRAQRRQRSRQRWPRRAAGADTGTLGRTLRRAPAAACRRPCWSGRRAGPPDGLCAPTHPSVPAVPSVSL
jgi:hypothetical protein